MKLLRFGAKGYEKPGILDPDGVIRDVSGHVSDFDGAALAPDELAALRHLPLGVLPAVPDNVRIGPCVANVGKFVCIGLNYADHAAESGMAIPDEPVIFMKATSAICGPNDNVLKPPGSSKLDWEVELGLVIGKPCAYVNEAVAAEVIAGYCVINDVSERTLQFDRGGQWVKGKGCDTFGPIGPWLVTKDEVTGVNSLDLWLDVNGERRQRGNTSTMIFRPDYLVSQSFHEPATGRYHIDRHAPGRRPGHEPAHVSRLRRHHDTRHHRVGTTAATSYTSSHNVTGDGFQIRPLMDVPIWNTGKKKGQV